MKTIIALVSLLLLFLNFFIPSFSQDTFKKQGENQKKQMSKPVTKEKTFKVNTGKGYKKIETKSTDKKESLAETVDWSGEEELISVNVKNEFDDEVRVKLDTNREYPVGPHEWITLGKRKPGRYTLTIYNKKGEFVDNLTRNIDNKNKFVLDRNIISNSDKITGLSTGQKVAIAAGAVGAAALGTALINKALQESSDQTAQGQYVPPQAIPPAQVQQEVVVQAPGTGVAATEQVVEKNNAFAPGGKALKVLNNIYPELTLTVEGADGSPIGNNWKIPKATTLEKPQPLIFGGEKITINPNQKIKAVIPNGFELQRYAFELDTDPGDGSYLWVVK